MARRIKYVPKNGRRCPKNFHAKKYGRNKGKCTTPGYARKKPCSAMTALGRRRTSRCLEKNRLRGVNRKYVRASRRARRASQASQGFYTFDDLG
jgi:hypothetical protein